MKKLLPGLITLCILGVAAPQSRNATEQLFTPAEKKKNIDFSFREKLSCIGKFISEDDGGEGSGTCFPVKKKKIGDKWKTYWLTNNHNLPWNMTSLRIELFGPKGKGFSDNVSRTFRRIDVVMKDSIYDVAMVSTLTEKEIPVLEMDYGAQESFKKVFVVGFPLGLFPHYTEGSLSTKIKTGSHIRWSMNAPIMFGNSGGPVIDVASGKVVGIASAIISSRDSLYNSCSLMVPLNSCFHLIEKALNEK